MANADHEGRLRKEGVAAWNRWRDAALESEETVTIDLSGSNLRGLDLQKCNLSHVILCRAKLSGAKLQQANLAEANLQSADLSQAGLQNAVLIGANLRNARLSHADLREAQMRDTCLKNADLSGADLTGARLSGAKLNEATTLYGAKLQGVDLAKATLDQTSFEGADLTRANLDGAKFHRVSLYGAILEGTRLRRQDIEGEIIEKHEAEERKAWDQVEDIYLELKNNFQQIGRYNESVWAYQQERKAEKEMKAPRRCLDYYGAEEPFPTSLRKHIVKLHPETAGKTYRNLSRSSPLVWWFWFKYTLKWLVDGFIEWLCGYGESIWRVLRAMFILWASFAGIFYLVGGVSCENAATGQIAICPPLQLFYFSLGAMAAMEPAGLTAQATPIMQILVPLEALLGIALTGLLGFVTGNRIRRA